MITEQGIVEEVLGHSVVVRIQRSAACASCDSKGLCRDMADKTMRLELENNIHAKEGDRVEITIRSGALAKISLLLYMIPAVALVVGAYGGARLGGLAGADSTLASIVGGLGAMGAIFYLIARMDKARGVREEFKPRLTRILSGTGVPEISEKERERFDGVLPPP